MSTAQQQHIGSAGSIAKDFVNVDVCDLLGDWMVDPPFFHQGNQQRASLFKGGNA